MTRSALAKVMISRYMRKHGINDAPDYSTPGAFAEESCGKNHYGDWETRVRVTGNQRVNT